MATNSTELKIVPTVRIAMAPNTSWKSEKAMNDDFILQFNNTGNFGGSRMPSPTMRIDPGMRLLLTSHYQVDGTDHVDTATYGIHSLELIGIAMHETPVAFVVVHHKTASATLTTRALTESEVKALKALQAGQEIVDEETKTERLVVVAVRAEQSCISCHSDAKVGDLLGAFTYHLTPIHDAANSGAKVVTGSP